MEPTLPTHPYISSTEASKRFGITNDYVGALCRRGKVRGALVGRLWYVHEGSLREYLAQMEERREARNKVLSKAMRHAWTMLLVLAVIAAPHAQARMAPVAAPAPQADIIPLASLAAHVATSLPHTTLAPTYSAPEESVAHDPLGLADLQYFPDALIDTTQRVEFAIGDTYWAAVQAYVDTSYQALDAAAAMYNSGIQAFVDSTYAARDLSAAAYGGVAQQLFDGITAVHAAQMTGIVMMGNSMSDGANEAGAAYNAASVWYAQSSANVTRRLQGSQPQHQPAAAAVAAVQTQPKVVPAVVHQVMQPTKVAVASTGAKIAQNNYVPSPAAVAAATTQYVTEDALTAQLADLKAQIAQLVSTQTAAAVAGIQVPQQIAGGGYGAVYQAAAAPPTTVTQVVSSLTADNIPPLNYFPATSTVAVNVGGTGTSTAPGYGQLLLGNNNGGYDLVGTSSLGISGGGGSSQWTTSGSNIYYSTGSVGIGTSSPTWPLSVVGTTSASGLYVQGTTTGSGTLTLAGANSGNPFSQEITNQVSGNNATLLFNLNHGSLPGSNESNTIRFNGPNTMIDAVNANDSLGIKFGESFNTAFIGLVSTGGANGSVPGGGFLLPFALGNNGKVGSITPRTSFGAPSWRNVLDDGSGNMSISGLATFITGLMAQASSTIGSGTQAGGLTINGGATTTGNAYFAGNVGIGTNSPSQTLVVNSSGASTVNINAGAGSNPQLLFSQSATTTQWQFLFSANGPGSWQVCQQGVACDFSIMPGTGNLDVGGNNAAGSKLSVEGNAAVGADYYTQAAPTNGLIVEGSIGIGTTTPGQALSVAGDILGNNVISSYFTGTSTATSTLGGGLNLTGGCFSVGGVCITGGGGGNNYASTTIGAGTQTAGLTISGGATTTGNAYFAGSVGIGAVSPIDLLQVAGLSKPVVASTINTGLSTPYATFVQGRYAYVVSAGNSSLVIFNISNPAAPAKIASITTGLSSPRSVYVSGRYAYVGSYSNSSLVTFDISNPASPVEVGSVSTGLLSPQSVYVQGRYAYVGNSHGVAVFDVSNPASAVLVGATPSSYGTATSVYVQGRYLYAISGGALNIFDISNPSTPVWTGADSSFMATPIGVYVQGRYAYVADNTNRLIEVDVSNPAAPSTVTFSNTGLSAPLSVYVQGRYAYVDDFTNGLVVFDVSNPANVVYLGATSSGLSGGRFVFVAGRYAYVASATNNSLVTFTVGGEYTQSLEAGSVQASSLSLDSNLQALDGAFAGGLVVGNSLNLGGSFSLTASTFNATTAASSTYSIFSLNTASSTTPLFTTLYNGNVGIGTTTPGSILSVNGVANFTSATSTFYSTGGLNLTGGCFSINNVCVTGGGSLTGTTGQVPYFSGTNTAAGTSTLFISTASKVGVGTNSPVATLHVLATQTNPGVQSFATTSTFAIGGTSPTGYVLAMGQNTSNNFWMQAGYTGPVSAYSNILLQPVGGNVGIGTTTPGSQLSIAKGLSVGADYTAAAPTNGAIFEGNVGIGILSPLRPLSVAVGSSQTVAAIFSTNDFVSAGSGTGMQFYMGASTGDTYGGIDVKSNGLNSWNNLVLQSGGGNVGIGSTTPNSVLAVDNHTADGSGPIVFAASTANGYGLAVDNKRQVYAGGTPGVDKVYDASLHVKFNSASAFTGIENIPNSDSATYQRFFNGSLSAIGSITENSTTGVAFNTISDRRLKENIATTTLGLADLMKIAVDTFSFISDPSHATTTGFIAQNVEQVFPAAVTTNGDDGVSPLGATSTPWAVDYGRITPLIVKAVQDIASLSDTFKNTLIAWLGDASNGIGKLFAREIHTQELCVGDGSGAETCLTKAQLDQLIAGAAAAQSATAAATASGDSATTTSAAATSTPDTEAPVITLNGDATVTVAEDASYIDLGATVSDNVNLNLGYRVSLDGGATTSPDQLTLDTSVPGTHTITYSATDQANNVGYAARTVIVGAPVSAATSTPAAETATSTAAN